MTTRGGDRNAASGPKNPASWRFRKRIVGYHRQKSAIFR
jgi:hypothetical protein